MKASTLKENIWRCSLLAEHVDKLKIKQSFWKDVLKSWSQYNFHHDVRIENQIIWYNSNIQVEGKPIFWKDVYDRGLKYVHQLFGDMEYKPYDQMREEFGLTELRYNSLKSALPVDWKNFFCSTPKIKFLPLPPHNYDQCLNMGGVASKVYRYMKGDVSLLHTKYMKWGQELGQEIMESIWEYGKIHSELYKLMNVTKYRDFQYRLLQRGLVTNIQLYKWGIKPSELCSFCGQERERQYYIFSVPANR